MLTNEKRREILETARAVGYKGSILDLFNAARAGQDISQLLQPQNMEVAQTPEQQSQGLRPQHAAGNTNASMAFPDVPPNTPFSTEGMKAPINISKFDEQGHLVQSFKNVPPGIQSLPTGPGKGTVIETPAYKKGGYRAKHQTGSFKDRGLPPKIQQMHNNLEPAIYDGMLDEVTVTPYTQSEYAFQEKMGNKATGRLAPTYPVFDAMTLGLKPAATAATKSIRAGIKNAPAKINPRYFKPSEDLWYRQVGKSAIDDIAESKVIRERGEDILNSQRVYNDRVLRMKGIDPDTGKPFANYETAAAEQLLGSRRPKSPYFQKGELYWGWNRKPGKGKLGRGGDADSEYLIESMLADDAFHPAHVKGMYPDAEKFTGDIGILKPRPEFRDPANFNLYQRNWWSGYKPIKKQKGGYRAKHQLGGVKKHQTGDFRDTQMLDEVQVTGKAVKKPRIHADPFGNFEGYVDVGDWSLGTGEAENLFLPLNFSGTSFKGVGANRVQFKRPGLLANQATDAFRNQYGYVPKDFRSRALGALTSGFRGKSDFKPSFKERLSNVVYNKGYKSVYAPGYDYPLTPTSFSNSYYTNPGDSEFNLDYLDLGKGKLDSEWGKEKINIHDARNMFDRTTPIWQHGLSIDIEPTYSGNVKKSRVSNIDTDSRAFDVATPFTSNLLDYVGSDTYFERLAAGQYADEIDVDKFSTDPQYRSSFANRLVQEKPEFIKNQYQSLTDQFKDGVRIKDVTTQGGDLASWASSATSPGKGGTELNINPDLFTKGKTREEVERDVTETLRYRNVSPYERAFTISGMQPEEFDEEMKNPHSGLSQARDMLVNAGMDTQNFDWRNTIGHELGHSISMSRLKSLSKDDLSFDNNDPNAYSNDYKFLYGLNNLTSGGNFYSLQDHLDSGETSKSYINTLNEKLEDQASELDSKYHLVSPEETVGDIHGVRSYNQRVYGINPKEPFTKEQLETLLKDDEFKKSLIYDRMNQRFGEDQSKWMKAMNLIASTEGNTNRATYAQKGGIREQAKDFPKTDLVSKYFINPAYAVALREAERVDENAGSPSSRTGKIDDFTAGAINTFLYNDPTTFAAKQEGLQKLRDYTFENVRPVAYPSVPTYIASIGNAIGGKLGITKGNAPPKRDAEGDYTIDEEMYAKAMNVPHKSKYISESKYKPSKAKDSDAKYYTLDWDEMIDKEKLIDYAAENKLMKGENMVVNSLAPFLKEGYMPKEEFKNIDPLQNFTIGLGEDNKGRYLSIYDKYDFNKTFNTVTSPFEIYDRFHLYKSGGYRNKYQFGGREGEAFQEVDTYIKPGQSTRPNWAQTPYAVTNYTFGKNLVDDESRFSLGLQGTDILDEIKYRADLIGSAGIGVGNRKGKSFRPAGENLRAGIRGQASWQGVPGNVLENMFPRSGVNVRGSFEGEAGLAYGNGAVSPYMSVTPQTNFSLNDNLSLGVGYEMRGRYDKNRNNPIYGSTGTGTVAPLSQRDAYSGMGRGAGRLSLKYDMGDGDFIEGYYSKPNSLYQGSMYPVPGVIALENEGPRFGVRLKKSF